MMEGRAGIMLRLGIAIVALGLSTMAYCSNFAKADTPITNFSAVPSNSQAGGHPDVEIQFEVKNRVAQLSETACDCEDAKNANVHLPAGFIGNPHATPQCSIANFSSDSCPIDSQVGIVHVVTSHGLPFDAALYNLVPPPEDAGLLAFKIFLYDTPQFTVLSARTGGDYGLNADATSIYHGAYPLEIFQEDIWGVPAESSHDQLRVNPSNFGGPSFFGQLCDAEGTLSTIDPNSIVKPCHTNYSGITPVPSNSPLTPFNQNPTNCDAPLSSSLEVLSYDGGVTHADYPWPQSTGCDQLSFNPSLYAQPTTNETDTASGIDVDLSVPQQLSPSIPSPSELKGATVTLPPGFTINPNAADGKTSCSETEAGFGTEEEGSCPEASKIGSLEIDSSALPGPLPGYVYLGQPLPGDRYRVFLLADGFATHIKLAGTVTPDPSTGQLSFSFQNLPQSPLTAFNLHIFGSERGLLATPTQCGTYPVTTKFTPWDSEIGSQISTQYFTLESGPNGEPCPGPQRPFDPSFAAESNGNTAGAHSTFALEVGRADGEQNLSGIEVNTPPGLSATLAGVSYCPDAALAHAAEPSYSGLAEEELPSCPGTSEIGTAVVGAGAGTHPVYVSGKVYLAGPYKGAPLSLAIITPAVSGPYDLGNVVVRVALHVDQTDAHITAISDPLPQILEGIPLRLRTVRISLDRQNFASNPTNCSQFSVASAISGDQGLVARHAAPYQVANCASLGFAPKLSLRLSGGYHRAENPALTTTLQMPSGDANIARAQITLPHAELVDNAHIRTPCTRPQFSTGTCPSGSVIGKARALTPLLEKPLEGPVYLMTGFGHKLPDLAADLDGQILILLHGKIDSAPNGGLRTTFETVPDAPVSSFTLNLDGGKRGLIQNSENICAPATNLRTDLSFIGQNGASTSLHPALAVACPSKESLDAPRHQRRSFAMGAR